MFEGTRWDGRDNILKEVLPCFLIGMPREKLVRIGGERTELGSTPISGDDGKEMERKGSGEFLLR